MALLGYDDLRPDKSLGKSAHCTTAVLCLSKLKQNSKSKLGISKQPLRVLINFDIN